MSKDYSVPLWKDFIIGTHQHEQLLAQIAEAWGDSDVICKTHIRDIVDGKDIDEVKEIFSSLPDNFVKFIQAICCSGLRAALLPKLQDDADEEQEETESGVDTWKASSEVWYDPDWWKLGPEDIEEE